MNDVEEKLHEFAVRNSLYKNDLLLSPDAVLSIILDRLKKAGDFKAQFKLYEGVEWSPNQDKTKNTTNVLLEKILWHLDRHLK